MKIAATLALIVCLCSAAYLCNLWYHDAILLEPSRAALERAARKEERRAAWLKYENETKRAERMQNEAEALAGLPLTTETEFRARNPLQQPPEEEESDPWANLTERYLISGGIAVAALIVSLALFGAARTRPRQARRSEEQRRC